MWTTKTPQILTNITTHWPAMATWHSASYWMDLTIGGRRLVPVEIGRSYTDDDWRQEIMPFRKFLETFIMHQDDEDNQATQARHFPELDILRSMICSLRFRLSGLTLLHQTIAI